MDALSKPRTWIIVGAVIALAVVVFWPGSVFDWAFSRVEAPPGYFVVRIHRWGKDLPQGASYSDSEILAPDESYKGVMADVLPEGRYFLNPFFWSTELHPMIEVPAGKVLVLTRMYGKPIPPERLSAGDFLAQDGERGIVAEVLRPGKHRVNPYAYTWKQEGAVEVGAGEVGVLTLKVGDDPSKLLADNPKRSPYVVPEGYRGVQEKPLSSGTYYVNPYVKKIASVDTRSHQAEFTDIEFPSKDGFHIKPHVLVTYRVLESKAPELFVTLSDDAELPLGDRTPQEIDKNPVLQKAVLPLIRGYARIEGSKMAGRDFVAQSATAAPGVQDANPREVLQKKLMDKVVPACEELGVVVESIIIGQSEKDADLETLATQIADREQARLEREKNASLIEQYKQAQELAATTARKEQNEEKVAATTKLNTATTEAKQKLEVEEKKLEQDLKNAETNLTAAKEQAQAVLAQGEADAEVITKENEAKVAGLRTAVEGFNSADQFAQYQMLTRLAPALKEIFASDTSDFAKLFASYMTQPPSKGTPAHVAGYTGDGPAPPMPPATAGK